MKDLLLGTMFSKGLPVDAASHEELSHGLGLEVKELAHRFLRSLDLLMMKSGASSFQRECLLSLVGREFELFRLREHLSRVDRCIVTGPSCGGAVAYIMGLRRISDLSGLPLFASRCEFLESASGNLLIPRGSGAQRSASCLLVDGSPTTVGSESAIEESSGKTEDSQTTPDEEEAEAPSDIPVLGGDGMDDDEVTRMLDEIVASRIRDPSRMELFSKLGQALSLVDISSHCDGVETVLLSEGSDGAPVFRVISSGTGSVISPADLTCSVRAFLKGKLAGYDPDTFEFDVAGPFARQCDSFVGGAKAFASASVSGSCDGGWGDARQDD